MENTSHVWSGGNKPHRVEQDGGIICLRQCSFCRRDFAKGIDGLDWRAVYIGVFKVELLADAVSARWQEEECPRCCLPDDATARTTRRNCAEPKDVGAIRYPQSLIRGHRS
jgi:hypothetical protein